MAKNTNGATSKGNKGTGGKGFKATACPITRESFIDNAKAVVVEINGVPLSVEVKEFSTGSFGWYTNGKTTVVVKDENGEKVAVKCQLSINLTVIGSKDAE